MSTVMITGGSRGIGAAAVRLFAARGDRVYFLYEKEHAAAQAVADQTGATPICCDVADTQAVQAVFARLPELDILVAGHHGSKHSTGVELLEVTKPKIVVISVGRNSYGHPAPELLERLEEVGALVYRTDIHGNIILRR